MGDLPERLREAADAHRPDRARILARVERAMAEPEPHEQGWQRTAPWMRVAAVTAAVAGAIGLGGLAVGAVGGGAGPGPASSVTAGDGRGPSAATHAEPGPRPGKETQGGTAGRSPSSPAGHGTPDTGGHRPAGALASGAPGGGATGAGAGQSSSPATPGRTGGDDGHARDVGDNGVTASAKTEGDGNAYWTQDDVVLTTDRPLTALSVELRVAMTPGVTNSGAYDSTGRATLTTAVEGDFLVYRWALRPGSTLDAGTYTFAGQFQHDEGQRSAGGDRFTVTGDGPAGSASLSGGY